jgi:hypothetical protein
MKGLNNIILEGRVEDAQQYFEKAVGSWPVAEPGNPAGIGSQTNLDGVLQHFVQNDPSGNNKYLMWMVKMYLNPEERGTSPNDISSLVQRFHKNVDRLNVAFIMNMDIFDPIRSRISTSPKNLDSYDDLSQLERVMDELDSIQTRKEKEKEAKGGVDKLYENDRWLLVRPNTYEGSCYYGSSTKWCTASKDAPQHFETYSKTGNLYYIIDKSKDVGDFFKIALHKDWNGKEEWYDRADNKLKQETEEAIRSLLPLDLVKSLEEDHGTTPSDTRNPTFTYAEFAHELRNFVNNRKPIKLNTKSGVWDLEISVNGEWYWYGPDPRVDVMATPFTNGHALVCRVESDDDDGLDILDADWDVEDLDTQHFTSEHYLKKNPAGGYMYESVERNLKHFIMYSYIPKVRKILDSDELVEFVGGEYKTWESNSYVSSFQFNYPPRKGTMTQKFVDYLGENPRSTSNQFYEDVLGYPRPRAHNNMFFSSIKDSGIVKMERKGRQFVYSIGPNYSAWTQGKLLRTNKKYGQL